MGFKNAGRAAPDSPGDGPPNVHSLAACCNWHHVANTVTAQSPPAQWSYEPSRTESDEAHRMRAWLTAISREDWLNEWTIEFIASFCRSLDKLSERQLACIDRIIHEAFDRG